MFICTYFEIFRRVNAFSCEVFESVKIRTFDSSRDGHCAEIVVYRPVVQRVCRSRCSQDNQLVRTDNLDAFISSKYSITTGYLARAVVNNILTGGQLETSAVDIHHDEDDANDDKCTVSWARRSRGRRGLLVIILKHTNKRNMIITNDFFFCFEKRLFWWSELLIPSALRSITKVRRDRLL